MVKELVHDPILLGKISAMAGKEDLDTARDLLDTLLAHRDTCVEDRFTDDPQELVETREERAFLQHDSRFEDVAEAENQTAADDRRN